MKSILLVPGLLCSPEIFGPQIAALWPHGPVTVANTLTGASMEEMAAAILREAPPRFALAGISMGGYLSFEIWRQAPERVDRIALIDTSAMPDGREKAADRRALVEEARRKGIGPVAGQLFARLVHPDRSDDADLLSIGRRMGEAVGTEVFARQQEAIIARPDSRPTLETIDVPTTIIVGEDDSITTPDDARLIFDGMRSARMVAIACCGHMSTLEQPERVNAALVEWLSD